MGPRQNSQRASPYVSHPTPVTPRRSHHVADPTGVLSERSGTYANSVHLALCQRRSLHRVRSLEESQLSHILNTVRLFPLACCQSPAKESAVYHILFTSTGSELAGGSDEMLFRHPRRPRPSSGNVGLHHEGHQANIDIIVIGIGVYVLTHFHENGIPR